MLEIYIVGNVVGTSSNSEKGKDKSEDVVKEKKRKP